MLEIWCITRQEVMQMNVESPNEAFSESYPLPQNFPQVAAGVRGFDAGDLLRGAAGDQPAATGAGLDTDAVPP